MSFKAISNLILNPDTRGEDIFDLCTALIRSSEVDEEDKIKIRKIQCESIPLFLHKYEHYNTLNVYIMNKLIREDYPKDKNITVTMTSCKRIDLFKKTVNSFLECVIDKHLIKEWIVVDDNSSNEDREEMRNLYPFIRFIYKTPQQKGHAKSMNMIIDNVKTPYVFHLEDDWTFFYPDQYLTKCRKILLELDITNGLNKTKVNVAQCLINKSYGEREKCYEISHGDPIYVDDCLYYVHDYGNDIYNQRTCSYWPYYSLRPGMMKTEVWSRLGHYDINAPHFEMEYAGRFAKMYVSVYMDSIYTYHTGRCTFERDDKDKTNAYVLNGESQFVKEEKKEETHEPTLTHDKRDFTLDLTEEEKKIREDLYDPLPEERQRVKTYVLNMEKRKDRKKTFVLNNHSCLYKLRYEFFKAVDGEQVKPLPKFLKLFETGDYNYRRGLIGCGLSHISMWKELYGDKENDIYLILEDDITLPSNFMSRFSQMLDKLRGKEWDVCFLGHFLYPELRKEEDRSETHPFTVQKRSKEWSVNNSMGGTIGYIINKKGALKCLYHLNERGMYNGIDWVMFKNSLLNIYYCYPHLVFSECATNTIKPDSDIQYNYNRLCDGLEGRLECEKEYWKTKGEVKTFTKLPIRDLLLTIICIVKIDNTSEESETSLQNIEKYYGSLPLGFYFIGRPPQLNLWGDIKEKEYVLSFPLCIIDDDIGKSATALDYMNLDYPV